jgi:hypothetical protein
MQARQRVPLSPGRWNAAGTGRMHAPLRSFGSDEADVSGYGSHEAVPAGAMMSPASAWSSLMAMRAADSPPECVADGRPGPDAETEESGR